ncbi:MAG: hypothetical protein AB8B61_01995 [Cyclobacteriaceae bacterium]
MSVSVLSQNVEQDDLYFTKKDRQVRIKKKKKKKELSQQQKRLVAEGTKQLITNESDGQYFNWIDRSITNNRPVDSLVGGYQPLYASDLEVIDPSTGYVLPYNPLLEPSISNPLIQQYVYPANANVYSPNYYQKPTSNVLGQTNPSNNGSKVVKRKQPIKRMSTTIKRQPVEKVRRPVQLSNRQPTYKAPSFPAQKEEKKKSSSSLGSHKRRVIRR